MPPSRTAQSSPRQANRGSDVSREGRVAQALRVTDPRAVRIPRRRPIKWRQYNTTEAMRLWSIDSYAELAEYGIHVHCIVDGGSHYVVAMAVRDNKRAETIFNVYAGAVRLFGRPVSIRSDCLLEDLINRDMRAIYPERLDAFLPGGATRSQRMYMFFRGLYDKVVWYYRDMVDVMENTGVLKMNNPWHRQSLKESWVPLIQSDVDVYIRAWNYHTVRASTTMPSHVPANWFQASDRLSGLIPPHTTKEIEFALEPESGPETTHVEEQAKLPEELKNLRDRAFEMNKGSLKADRIFLLHLDLSLECSVAARSEESTRAHLQQVEASNRAHRKNIATMLLSAM